jgi:hypothetical protein
MSHDIWNGVTDTRFLVLGARFGRVLSTPRGPGFLKGNLEFSVELLPLFLVDTGDTTYGASLTFLGRHFFRPEHRFRPYAVLGLGGLRTKKRIPEEGSRSNFAPQIGLGLAYANNKRFVFYVEYRLHHISSGVQKVDGNPGINSSYIQFSLSIFRW